MALKISRCRKPPISKIGKIIPDLLLSIFLTSFMVSCKETPSIVDEHDNSIYYWRTTFSLSDGEKEFIRNHDINKIYMRFFDVASDYDENYEDIAVPQATIIFNDSVPTGIEIIPTIYITTDAIKNIQTKEKIYAAKILKRINAICRHNNLDYNEIQLDCDWTKSTRDYFFRLYEEMKQQLDTTKSLSSTIRLHQLNQTPPPVDKGVLMVYNTGNFREMTTENSIFSKKDIEPYLRDNRLSKYPLSLDIAYPAYGWSLVFINNDDNYKFKKIIKISDLSSYPEMVEVGINRYLATEQVDIYEDTVYMGSIYPMEVVRTEQPDTEEILMIKEMIDNQLKGKAHNNILYHLDEEQLSHYSDYEISQIYSRN